MSYVKILDAIFFEATEQDVAKRIPLWMDKYDVSRDLILSAIAADPTNGKYSEWIVKQIKNGTVIFPEDQDKIRKNLQLFHTKKSKLAIRDINQYDPGSLAQALDQQLGLTKSERKAARRGDLHLPPGAELVLSDGLHDVVVIGSDDLEEGVKAANLLSSGTQWCTAVPHHAESYLKDGPLYLIYENSSRKYLVHFPSDQFKDVYDKEVDGPLSRTLSTIARKYYQIDLNKRAGKSTSTEDVKGFIIGLLYPITGINHHQVPSYAIAQCVATGKRDPKAEPYLSRSVKGVDYAARILNDRWPELEEYLLSLTPKFTGDSTPSRSLYNYTWRVLKPLGYKRWPAAEPNILNDIFYATYYAIDVLGRRWPELEMRMINTQYGRNPSGSGVLASLYAIDVLKSRWHEMEDRIITAGGNHLDNYIIAFNLKLVVDESLFETKSYLVSLD